ncbi:hypothetical protein BDQ12DRAFT_771209 [Crucibulum laeve]|uniref:BTB domain-containing protein n=1 Tax=Crucibulum laeve TaxID=68775 RepID=A0A5C3LJR8_9AGAR|nr:hypothetical protein BDQ12DRAFT_771209 [Crucibulum laeve]
MKSSLLQSRNIQLSGGNIFEIDALTQRIIYMNDQSPQNDPDLYFEDGNVIFQAQNTNFRLHRSIIATRSSVFRDMFSFPQHSDASDRVDGCVVICLPDSAEDMQSFFLAIYDFSYFNPYPCPVNAETVASVLAISHKYDASALFNRAHEHLSHVLPCTLDEWLEINGTGSVTFSPNRVVHALLKIIIVTSTINAVWLLPTALYILCNHPLERILDHPYWNSGEISESLKRNILVGYKKQLVSILHRVRDLTTYAPTDRCISQRLCTASVRAWDRSHRGKPIGWFSPMSKKDSCDASYYDALCKECAANLKPSIQNAKEEMWNSLPLNFGLPAWEELKRLKEGFTLVENAKGESIVAP